MFVENFTSQGHTMASHESHYSSRTIGSEDGLHFFLLIRLVYEYMRCIYFELRTGIAVSLNEFSPLPKVDYTQFSSIKNFLNNALYIIEAFS